MIMRWSVLTLTISLLGAILALSACANQPGDNAYGRYSNPSSSKSSIEPYNEDYYKDHGGD